VKNWNFGKKLDPWYESEIEYCPAKAGCISNDKTKRGTNAGRHIDIDRGVIVKIVKIVKYAMVRMNPARCRRPTVFMPLVTAVPGG